MKLKSLKLKNFKGIKDFTLDTKGQSVTVKGNNRTGKTSLIDAYHWLLFGKDALDRQEFGIKTTTKDGKVIHGLDHEVEGVFEVNGKDLTFTRRFREVWSSKKGSANKVLNGHTTDYFINGAPIERKRDYDDRINEIIAPKLFKLLSNPLYLLDMHWEKRRDLLIKTFGDVTDTEVLSTNKKLGVLKKLLDDNSIKEVKKMLAAKRKKVNEERERLPIRIDEVVQGLPDISIIKDPKSIEKDLKKLADGKAKKESELAKLISGGSVGDNKQKIAEIESKLLTIETNHKREVSSKANVVQDEISEHNRHISNLRSDIDDTEKRAEKLTRDIESLTKKMEELRDEWHEVNGQALEPRVDETCPTCGQDLPADKVQEARDKAIADFNLKKSEKLERITQQGKNAKKNYDVFAKGLKSAKKQKVGMQKILEEAVVKSAELQSELAEIESAMDGYKDLPEYKKLMDERDRLQKAIDGDQSAIEPEKARFEDEIEQIGQAINALNEAKARLELHKQGKNRIEELMKREKELAAEYESVEKMVFLTEEFNRTKTKMLEDKINSQFSLVKWRLFKEQMNGGVEEVCQAMINGVPYGEGLNTEGILNAGIDIINTFSKHYGVNFPVWIDNAESTTEFIPCNSQLIKLVKPEIRSSDDLQKYSQLVVEVDENKAEQQSLFEEAI